MIFVPLNSTKHLAFYPDTLGICSIDASTLGGKDKKKYLLEKAIRLGAKVLDTCFPHDRIIMMVATKETTTSLQYENWYC